MFQTVVLICLKASNQYAAISFHNVTKYGNYKQKIWIAKSIIDCSGNRQSSTTINVAEYGWSKVSIIVLKLFRFPSVQYPQDAQPTLKQRGSFQQACGIMAIILNNCGKNCQKEPRMCKAVS